MKHLTHSQQGVLLFFQEKNIMFEDYDLDMYVDDVHQAVHEAFEDQPSGRTEEELDFYFDDEDYANDYDPENPDDNH